MRTIDDISNYDKAPTDYVYRKNQKKDKKILSILMSSDSNL
jgi:hypothetical protein